MWPRLLPAVLALAAGAAAARAADHPVVASSFQFTPANVNAAPGDTVSWTGLSGGFHPVVRTTDASGCTTFAGAGAFNSGALSSFVFTVPIDAVPGTIIFYKCNNHCACCVMRGTITVMASPPLPCPGDADGSGAVNFADITAVLTNFGLAGPVGDADHNNTVNFADVTAVLTNFGVPCP